MRYVKNVPSSVLDWFKINFPNMTYKFYVYKINKLEAMSRENRVFGCEVFNNNGYFHNGTQATIDFFEKRII